MLIQEQNMSSKDELIESLSRNIKGINLYNTQKIHQQLFYYGFDNPGMPSKSDDKSIKCYADLIEKVKDIELENGDTEERVKWLAKYISDIYKSKIFDETGYTLFIYVFMCNIFYQLGYSFNYNYYSDTENKLKNALKFSVNKKDYTLLETLIKENTDFGQLRKHLS